MLLVVDDTVMEKIYHIYKDNQCVSPCLSEEEFRVKWNHLTGEKEEYQYEELEVNTTITHNASY